ncbi:MAG: PAS/PAC sensor signal transduction histidine kinase [uncultured bacterium]|nr:MAG: PAS/PAC sensor signal transduction histidine kinase [uncultured bacterium]
MRIVTHTRLITLLSIVLVAAFGASLLFSFYREENSMVEETISHSINAKVMDINLLTNDYLLSRSERAMRQWWAVYDELGRLCAPAVFARQEPEEVMNRIIEKHVNLSDIFSSLLVLHERTDKDRAAEEMEKRLFSRLLIETQLLFTLSHKLHELTIEHSRTLQQSTMWLRMSLFIALFVVMSANSFWLLRKLVAPIDKLIKGTEIIGSGKLEYKVATEANDEIGELSRSFDRMTASIMAITASRDELDREVGERKKAEEMLRKAMENLERSNRELEEFAYIASHDLQEPLHKIMAFGELLKLRTRDSLSEQNRDYIDRMRNAAIRMRQLIDDLLMYSRVTTQGRPFERVNLADVLVDVISVFDHRLEKTRGEVVVGPLPSVLADRLQMGQLFQNLIGNALKFRKTDVAPSIRVNSRLIGNGLAEIRVDDNGIGFDEKNLDRIFTLFQRLHGRDEFAGTGIGLALCRKIVERHGGTLTAQSTPGEGASFVVILPVGRPNPAKED